MENQVALRINDITEMLQTAPDVLQRNELSVSKCRTAGQAFIDTIEGAGGRIVSDEMDASVKAYLDKVNVTVKNMNERRKPVTQILTSISKRFTSLEGEIDPKGAGTLPNILQSKRNDYAAWKIAEQKKREEEARRAKAAEDEKISYRSGLSALLDTVFSEYEGRRLRELHAFFEGVTLNNYGERLASLQTYITVFDWKDFCAYVKDGIVTSYIDAATREAIKLDVAKAKKIAFARRYQNDLTLSRSEYIDRMPSKKKSLEEEAILRQKDAEAASKAEEERKLNEAAELAKAETERLQRESEAAARIEAERRAAEAASALNFMNEITPAAATKVKVTKKIQVLNPRGFAEIYHLWFIQEGVNCTMEDLEKIHKKMISFCEKKANSDGGETIKSAFVKYVDDVKAK